MSEQARPIFHHAFTVLDIEATRAFYGGLLGCAEGRRSGNPTSCDFDFFGHDIVTHLTTGEDADFQQKTIEGKKIVKRHFGVIVGWDEWHALADKLKRAGATFYAEPKIRDEGGPKEEGLMMVLDPSGNGIEFKALRHANTLFAKSGQAHGS